MGKEACLWGKSEAHTLYCEGCYAAGLCAKAVFFENVSGNQIIGRKK